MISSIEKMDLPLNMLMDLKNGIGMENFID
jgi:hypothetical protein